MTPHSSESPHLLCNSNTLEGYLKLDMQPSPVTNYSSNATWEEFLMLMAGQTSGGCGACLHQTSPLPLYSLAFVPVLWDCVCVCWCRILLVRSATGRSPRRITGEPWASSSCMISPTRTPSMLFKTGERPCERTWDWSLHTSDTAQMASVRF